MRHSKIDLTMNVYTDPALLDVRGPSTRCRRCRWEGIKPKGKRCRRPGRMGTQTFRLFACTNACTYC